MANAIDPMRLDSVLNFVPTFVLVVFRLAGMALYAPLFGAARIPKRVRVALILVLGVGMTAGVKAPPQLPDTAWGLALGIGGEIAFGLAMGMVMSFVFVAVQWAGEIVGQQMGLTLGGVIDPEYGGQSSVMGDLNFMFTLAIFLLIGGHRTMIRGVRASFDALPLLSLSVDQNLLETLLGLLHAATIFAVQLAAPILVTFSDSRPGARSDRPNDSTNEHNVGGALTVRAGLGILIVWLGLNLTGGVIGRAIERSMQQVQSGWKTGTIPAAAHQQ